MEKTQDCQIRSLHPDYCEFGWQISEPLWAAASLLTGMKRSADQELKPILMPVRADEPLEIA